MYTIFQAAVMFPAFPDGEIVIHNFPVGFRKVAKVNCADPEQAFTLTNHLSRRWQDNQEVQALTTEARSTSVGDIIVTPNGHYLYVCAIGLQELQPGDDNTLSATIRQGSRPRIALRFELCATKHTQRKANQELFRDLAPYAKPTLEQQLWDFATLHCKRLIGAQFEQAHFAERNGDIQLIIPGKTKISNYRVQGVSPASDGVNRP